MAKTPSGTAAKSKPQPARTSVNSAGGAKGPKPEKTTAPAADAALVAAAPEGAPGVLRFKELVEEVVKSTGAKPKDAKEIALATLTAIGAALGRGDALNLPEFGKGRIARSSVDEAGNAAIVLKLRRGEGKKKEGKEALAEAAE